MVNEDRLREALREAPVSGPICPDIAHLGNKPVSVGAPRIQGGLAGELPGSETTRRGGVERNCIGLSRPRAGPDSQPGFTPAGVATTQA